MTEHLTDLPEHLLIVVLAGVGAGFLLNRLLWWVFE